MFNELTDKMAQAMKRIRGLSHLSEDNVSEALKEVRTALLAADVHFKVVREFIDRVQTKCLGQAVTSGVNPGQMMIKLIHDELVTLLGEGSKELLAKKPLSVMVVGLHGSGKTTSAAKLAVRYQKKGYQPALIACDVYRPAAIDQLRYLAQQANLLFYGDSTSKNVLEIAQAGLSYAQEHQADLIIFDTAGRLQIDETLIEEIKTLHQRLKPDEVLLVADSALGQEAVNVAKHFHEAVQLSGIILTKLDGDARAGAALSMKAITHVPLRYLGTGEKLDQLEVFHADRLASRILGMGDVVSLVEKAQAVIDEKEAQKMAEKIKKATFTLEDFLKQMQQMKKLGPLSNIIKMLPGAHGLEIGDEQTKELKKTEAILQSMTPLERQRPDILNGSRRMRIAQGSGTKVSDVNEVLKKFSQMQKMMKMFQGNKGKALMERISKGKGPGSMPGF